MGAWPNFLAWSPPVILGQGGPPKSTRSIMVPYWTQWTLMDPQNKKSSLKGQEFFISGSTKVHQVQYGTVMDLVDFSGPKNQKILVLKDKKICMVGPLKSTSFFVSLCKTKWTLVDPENRKFGSTKVHKFFLSHFAKPNAKGSTKVHEFGSIKVQKNIGRNPIVDCEQNGERQNEKNRKEQKRKEWKRK